MEIAIYLDVVAVTGSIAKASRSAVLRRKPRVRAAYNDRVTTLCNFCKTAEIKVAVLPEVAICRSFVSFCAIKLRFRASEGVFDAAHADRVSRREKVTNRDGVPDPKKWLST